MPAYTVTLTLGAYSLTVAQGDPVDLATDPVVALDGLTMAWRYAGDDFPSPLEPLQATVFLATRDVTELESLNTGDLAVVSCADATGWTFAAVYGTVAEITATQSLRAGEVWTVYTVQVVDASITVDEPMTGALPGDPSRWLDHMTAMSTLSGVPIRIPPADPPGAGPLPADVTEVGVVTRLRDLATQIIDRGLSPLDTLPPYSFLMVAPITTTTGTFQLLSLHSMGAGLTADLMPGTLEVRDGRLTLVGATWAAGIPADQVHMDGQWRKGREHGVNAVTVRLPNVAGKPAATARAPRPAGVPLIRRVVELPDVQADTTRLMRYADTLLATSAGAGWEREAFVWSCPDPALLLDNWFPDWSTARYSPQVAYRPPGRPVAEALTMAEPAARCFRAPVGVFGMLPTANLSGARVAYAGLLTAVEIRIAGGGVTVAFSLRRLPMRQVDTPNPSAPTWADLRAAHPTPAYRSGPVVVDPGLTLEDYQLVREA